MNIQIGFVFLAVVAVVGAIEYLKGWFKEAPSWVWRLVLPFFCALVALAFGGTPFQMMVYGLVILAICELCYQMIVQKIPALLEAAASSIGAPAAGSSDAADGSLIGFEAEQHEKTQVDPATPAAPAAS